MELKPNNSAWLESKQSTPMMVISIFLVCILIILQQFNKENRFMGIDRYVAPKIYDLQIYWDSQGLLSWNSLHTLRSMEGH